MDSAADCGFLGERLLNRTIIVIIIIIIIIIVLFALVLFFYGCGWQCLAG